MAEPVGLGGVAEYGLHRGEGDQFGIAQAGRNADGRAPRRQVGMVLQHFVGRRLSAVVEGVHVVRHKTILDSLILVSAGTLGPHRQEEPVSYPQLLTPEEKLADAKKLLSLPRIVVICGSTRFMTEMNEADLRETKAGKISSNRPVT